MNVSSVFKRRPNAVAEIAGSPDYPDLRGTVQFYKTNLGVIVLSEITGLPNNGDKCRQPVFGFHIHEGGACSGNESDYFADALTHYNPNSCPHPYHAGDMPPLFGANGVGFSVLPDACSRVMARPAVVDKRKVAVTPVFHEVVPLR